MRSSCPRLSRLRFPTNFASFSRRSPERSPSSDTQSIVASQQCARDLTTARKTRDSSALPDALGILYHRRAYVWSSGQGTSSFIHHVGTSNGPWRYRSTESPFGTSLPSRWNSRFSRIRRTEVSETVLPWFLPSSYG